VIITVTDRIVRDCVIGANAVVARIIPDYCVAVSVSANEIKNRSGLGNKMKVGN
jgi:acetyltransferase-like isoleucine patch superfamily enzyme